MHSRSNLRRFAIAILLATVASGAMATSAASQTPLPAPSPLRKAAAEVQPEVSWYQDAKWWGIIVSGFIGLFSLGFQIRNRSADVKEKVFGGEFDGSIKEPITAACKELRALNQSLLSCADIESKAARTAAFNRIRKQEISKAFSLFEMSLRETDVRLQLKGDELFSEINVELEDAFYPQLEQFSKAQSAAERRSAARLAGKATVAAINACHAKLREHRARFVRKRGAP